MHCFLCRILYANAFIQTWYSTRSRGTFFFEEDNNVVSHQYTLRVKDTTKVWITIEPVTLNSGGLLKNMSFVDIFRKYVEMFLDIDY